MFEHSTKTPFTSAGRFVDITPDRPLPLVGYGHERPVSRAVREPLEANAVLFRHADRLVVFVQLDVLSVGDRVRRSVLDGLSGRLREDQLFLAASHTHSAPGIDDRLPDLGRVDEDYLQSVAGKTTQLVRDLLDDDSRPASLSYGEAKADHGMNRRRWCWGPKCGFPPVRRVMGLQPNAGGPTDETVRVISVGEETARTPTALLWNYACHPVGTVTFDPAAVSSDYPGVVRRRLREQSGNSLSVVFLPGFFGNVRPNRTSRFPTSPYRLLHRLVNGPVFGDFRADSYTRWTDSLAQVVSAARSDSPRDLSTPHIRTARLCRPLRELMDGELDDRRLAVQLVQLGDDCTFMGLSAEPVVEYAAQLGRLFPAGAVIPVGYLDSVLGYLPVSEMLSEGGLEVRSDGYRLDKAKYREGVSRDVLDTVERLARESGLATRTNQQP